MASSLLINKKGSLKIMPVYEDEECVPALLTPLLRVEFLKDNFIDFVLELRKEILRESRAKKFFLY